MVMRKKYHEIWDSFLQLIKKVCYNTLMKSKREVSIMDADNQMVAHAHGEVDSIDFAIYLSKKAQEFGKTANVTKIQKWLYICYGLYLAAYERQLLTERPKAWDYGPAFPRVHKKQKKTNDGLTNLINTITNNDLTKYDPVIRATLDNFGDWTAGELVAWTHEPDKAWRKTLSSDGIYAAMSNENISKDFKEMFKDG